MLGARRCSLACSTTPGASLEQRRSTRSPHRATPRAESRLRAVSDPGSAVEGRFQLGKRQILFMGCLTWAELLSGDRASAELGAVMKGSAFQSFRDPAGRYVISIPQSWNPSEKPGAEVLFKNPLKGSSNLGITINPVKISSLEKFGSIDEICQRLLNVERQKDGFLSVELLEQSSQSAKEDTQYYIYAYELNTTRGTKRIITGVTIDGYRLFIVNGSCKSAQLDDFSLLKQAVTSFKLS